MEFFARTDVGKKRENNEDSYFAKKFNDNVSLFIVADGLGGYLSGEVASKVLVERISLYIEENLSRIEKADKKKINNILNVALTIANNEIYVLEKTDEKYKGMGTTIVLLLIVKKKLFYMSVGDSRLYYMDNKLNKIEQITIDDTYVNELIKTNVIDEEDAKNHPQRHVLTKAIGILKNVSAKVEVLDIDEGYLLLCSDGVTNMITDDMLMDIFRKNELCNVADKVVEVANLNGGLDNITLIVIKL